MYIQDTDPILDALTFRYVVPHTPSMPEEVSPFQMFSPGLFETLWAFDQIATLPRDAAELVLDSRDLIRFRIAGRGLAVIPVPTDLFEMVSAMFSESLVVVLSSTSKIAEAIAPSLDKAITPMCHVTPNGLPVNRDSLRDYCLSMAEHWATKAGFEHHAKALNDGLKDWRDPLGRHELSFMDRNHLLTLPNMRVLAGAGYSAQPWDHKPLVSNENAPYFAALEESIRPIVEVRNDLIHANPSIGVRSQSDTIVAVPSVIKLWAQNRNQLRELPKHERKLVKSLLRQIVARDTYGLRLEIPDGIDMQEAMATPTVKNLVSEHAADLKVFARMLAVRAASSFTPVIRLPPAPNGAATELSQFASATRAHSGGSQHKLNRLARNLSDRLSMGLPEWVLEHIQHAHRIKLVSDVPLEWMSIDGFPLMLRSDTSRIPVTPGNLFAQQMLRCTEIPIKADAFQEVLICRSFLSDDPIRPLLENAIRFFSRGNRAFPRCRFVDVRNRSDLVKALEEFRGAILVYDGHGSHSKSTDVGELALAEEQVDAWTLRGEVRVPPIVLLSACDTHPFDASHMTVANGFLAAGAVTVLGTSVPVQGVDSAVMMARILLRVGAIPPLLIKHRPWSSFRWSEILPGLQRRQYVTDALRILSRNRILAVSTEVSTKTEIDIGIAIEQKQDWLQLLIDKVSRLASCSQSDAKKYLQTHVSFAESLLYSQLGNPELLVGFGDSVEPTEPER